MDSFKKGAKNHSKKTNKVYSPHRCQPIKFRFEGGGPRRGGGGVLLVSDSATTINHSIYATHFLNGVLKSIPTIEVLQKSTEKTKQYGIYKNIAFSHASSVLLLYMLTENLLLYLPKQVFCMFQYNEGKRRWHHINDT